MNHELRRVSPGEMLAYVDDCMPPADRAALEVRMARDHAVRNQIDIWLSQNEAIRGAFPGAAARPKAEGRSASKDYIPERRRQSVATRDLDRSPQVSAAPVGETKPTRQASGVLRRVLRVLAGGLAIWIGGAFICSGDRSSDFAKAAGAAYRTFADSATHPVELATADRRALNKWLVQQTEFSAGVPDLAAAGLSLLGGRIVPGSNSPAGFLLFETSQRERVALQIEPLDSPPESVVEIRDNGDLPSAAWTDAGGSFVLVGRVSNARLASLARAIRENESKN